MTDVLDRLQSALADRYTIDRELGRGGMATVYLARDLKHDRQVALKLLRPELGAVLGGERFLNEIRVTANLNHPHILPLLDSGTAGPPERPTDFLYYVMPYVAGESLRERLERETQLSIEEAVELTRQAASALDYAHRQGVVHRDIKPENILLQEGQAVVADFGIARALRVAGGERLTETGLSLGTPHYMSPEQASGTQELDGRSDVYSLACVLYEMLVGDPPFTGPTAPAVIARQLVDPVPSMRTVRPTVPEKLECAIEKALAKVPADRYPTAGVFVEECGTAAQVEVVPTRERRLPELHPGRNTLRRSIVPAVVGAVLAIAVVAGFFLWPRGPTLDRHLIAVTPFATIGSGLERWHQDAPTLLAARLDGAGTLRTAPQALVREHWSREGDRAAALHLARDVGSGLVLIATVVETVGDSVRISATLVDAETGDALEQPEVTGLSEPMGDLVDSLATRVLAVYARDRMPASVRWTSLGSSNPRAIKEFLAGELEYRSFKPDSARQRYERAIAEDSGFALAYRRLAYASEMAEGLAEELWAIFPPWGGHDALRLKAGSLNRGLAPRESLLVVADSIWAGARLLSRRGNTRVGSEADGLHLRLFRTLEAARQSYRQDPEVLFLLGHLVLEKGAGYGRRPEEAVEALDGTLTIDPGFLPGYSPLVCLELYYRGHEAGLQTIGRYVARAGNSPHVEAYRIAAEVIASGGHDTPEATRRIDALRAEQDMITARRAELWLAWESVVTSARLYPPEKLLEVVSVSENPYEEWPRALFGRVREARSIRDSLAPPDPPHIWWPEFYPYLARVGVVSPDTASQSIRDYLHRFRGSHIPIGFRWWFEQGDTATLKRAVEVLESYPESHVHIMGTPTRRVLDEASAHLALLRADTAEALALLTRWRPCPIGGWCSPADYATAQLLAADGRLDLLKQADALSGWAMFGSYDGALTMMQHALLRGSINEQLDRLDVAAWSYQVVLDFWAEGDPEVQPWVEEARAGLARLGVEERQ